MVGGRKQGVRCCVLCCDIVGYGWLCARGEAVAARVGLISDERWFPEGHVRSGSGLELEDNKTRAASPPEKV